MEPRDDYQDEMDMLSPDEIDGLLSGRAPANPAGARLAGLVVDLRRNLREEPAPDVAGAHVAAMVAAAGDQLPETRRSRMRVLTKRRIGGVALAATLILGGGLAAAVTLPEQAAEEAWEAVGQGQELAAEASAHGKAVSEVAQDPTLDGCEKGQAVAAVASSREERQEDAERPNPCAQAEDNNNDGAPGDQGAEASAFGKATAEKAQEDGQAFGRDTATEAQENGAAFGSDTAGEASGNGTGNATGNGTGADSADDGMATAAEGMATAEDASGGAAGIGGVPGGPPGS
jgi:hypothetical protein